MGIIRSALTANVVMGLPNVRDYIHKDRNTLMEERRLRIMSADHQNGDMIDTDDSNDSLTQVD
jgi:kelch-like protein 10